MSAPGLRQRSTWVRLAPAFRRRDPPGSVKAFWRSFDTVRRWHEHGHAAVVKEMARAWLDCSHIGTIDRFTFIESPPGVAIP